MTDETLSLLILLSGPMVVGAVTGAWLATGRLYVARLGGVRLPVWVPWIMAPLGAIAGLVVAAGQLIAATERLIAGPSVNGGSAALMAVLLSPAWMGAAAMAALGVALHYVLDRLLGMIALSEVVFEGLAGGLRITWAVIGLLALLVSLQATYTATTAGTGITLEQLIRQGGVFMLMTNVLAIGLALFAMIVPWLMARVAQEEPAPASDSPAAKPGDSPADR